MLSLSARTAGGRSISSSMTESSCPGDEPPQTGSQLKMKSWRPSWLTCLGIIAVVALISGLVAYDNSARDSAKDPENMVYALASADGGLRAELHQVLEGGAAGEVTEYLVLESDGVSRVVYSAPDIQTVRWLDSRRLILIADDDRRIVSLDSPEVDVATGLPRLLVAAIVGGGVFLVLSCVLLVVVLGSRASRERRMSANAASD